LLRRMKGKTGWGSIAQRFGISLSILLLICLILTFVIQSLSVKSARDSFWEQQYTETGNHAEEMAQNLQVMDGFTRQLLTENKFIRFTNMSGIEETGYMYTAYELMSLLTTKSYSFLTTPVRESHILLDKSGFVLSSSQFTEANQYFRYYRTYETEQYEEWIRMLREADGNGVFRAIRDQGNADIYYLMDIDQLSSRSVPAIIWFEMDTVKLKGNFAPEKGDPMIVLTDAKGNIQLVVAAEKISARDADGVFLDLTEDEIAAAEKLAASETENARDGERHLMRIPMANGWTCFASVAENICDEAIGDYRPMFFGVLLLALIGGIALVAILVRMNMRPVEKMGHELVRAENDREELQREVESQKPMTYAWYLRKVLSGHVSSESEFEYMMDYLGMPGPRQYYVLYCYAQRQDPSRKLPEEEQMDILNEYLRTDQPIRTYAATEALVILVSYPPDFQEPLMDLQHRVVRLHEELAVEHSIWFYAGVGSMQTEASRLWESYEQARGASRYTAKDHIFLPWELIPKQPDTFYYPFELSSKLLHFITTGNQSQADELLRVIYQENMEDRSLPVTQVQFLLSDLRSTLLRARSQIAEKDGEEEKKRLAKLDTKLGGTPSFPMIHECADEICGYFAFSREPSNPIPDIEKYLTENYADPSLSLTKLSAQFNISESYLSHLFKEKTGRNFSAFLEGLRLSEAAKRLKSGSGNVSDIAEEVGYNNPTTFRRAFKKMYGVTPSEMMSQGRE